jgi:signal transduction histidine kinase
LAHLSEAFYRPDGARLRSAGGVGLGLYLVRLVAQAHGGHWQVQLAHPGLRVRVDLPQAASH